MDVSESDLRRKFPQLRWPFAATLAGLWVERLLQALWPLLSWSFIYLGVFLVAGPLARGPVALVLAGAGALALAGLGARHFRRPRAVEVWLRLDEGWPDRPLAGLADQLALGAGDRVARALWQRHLERMAGQISDVGWVAPRPDLAAHDPFALRLIAALVLAMAGFATLGQDGMRAGGGAAPGGTAAALGGYAWEGWVTPPGYTGMPVLYLADLGPDPVEVPAGSAIAIRIYDMSAGEVRETVSGQAMTEPQTALPGDGAEIAFDIAQSGEVSIGGKAGRAWRFSVLTDLAPAIRPEGRALVRLSGEWAQGFVARDDHGVQSGFARIELNEARVERRFGLAVEPEPRAPLVLDLPLPFARDRREIEGLLEEYLAADVWAGLPVRLTLGATDALRQVSLAEPLEMTLPARRFASALAASLVEQRRDLLWSRQNARRVSQILRALANRPETGFDTPEDAGELRGIIDRLDAARTGEFATGERDGIADALWDLASKIEQSDLADALNRLRRAQSALEEGLRDGASGDALAELMQELRDAIRDYLRQLAERGPDQGSGQSPQAGDDLAITQEQLDQMLNRLQDLMRQGRMAEAQQMLRDLQQMMENMQVTEGGAGGIGSGAQALRDLGETLRRQQELSDDTFGQMQHGLSREDENAGGGDGQDGTDGATGGQPGTRGQGGQSGPGSGTPDPGADSGQQGTSQGLAERQGRLGESLDNQRGRLPVGPGDAPSGGSADMLREAERAMRGAEDALRRGDMAGALDEQARALDRLREGLRELSDELASNLPEGQQGQAAGSGDNGENRDPLGRLAGNAGSLQSEGEVVGNGDLSAEAQRLLGEIRRRSAERDRPEKERDYLRRLVEPF